MSYIPEDVNIRGIFRKYDKNGNLNTYLVGDVVDYENKKYIATETIIGIPPSAKNSKWKEFEVSARFYYSSMEPPTTTEGDRWLDKVSGRMYTRVLEDSGFIWVEL